MERKDPEATAETLEVASPQEKVVPVCLIGHSPLILHRMSEKAKRELLLPQGKKTAADKKTSIKHDPFEEFREAPYIIEDENAPTLLAHLSTAFKGAMREVAVDVKQATKAQIGRMVWIEGDKVPVYGIPKAFLSITRSSDRQRTPDVRTRAILPEWACWINIRYMPPYLTAQTCINLLQMAGLTQGIGDWRPEKGAGNYGQFGVTNADAPEFQRIVQGGGRTAQEDAMQNPAAYDRESADLLAWAERQLRAKEAA